MSFDIGAVGSAQSASQIGASTDARPASRGAVAQAEGTEEAVEVGTMPFEPPPEVMDAISTASSAYDRLQASGRQLTFSTDTDGRLAIALQDLTGNHVSTVTPTQVLAIAAGETA